MVEPIRRDLGENLKLTLSAEIPTLAKSSGKPNKLVTFAAEYAKLEQLQDTVQKSAMMTVAVPFVVQVVA